LRGTARGARGDEQDAREQAEQAERAEHAQEACLGGRFPRIGGATPAGGCSHAPRETCQGGGRLHAPIVTSRGSARLWCGEYPLSAALYAGGIRV
jgi:hypothetical protein